MKGDTVIGEMLGFFVLLGMGMFLGILLIQVNNIVNFMNDHQTYDLTVQSVYKPLTAETELLSFLELTEPNSGKKVKEILSLAIDQGDFKKIYVDQANLIDFQSFSSNIFNYWSSSASYALVMSTDYGTQEIIINGNLDSGSYQISSAKIISSSGKIGKLQLIIGEKQ